MTSSSTNSYRPIWACLAVASCSNPHVALVKCPKIRSCDLVLSHVTLKLNGVIVVFEVHVGVKFYLPLKRSGS